ILEEILSKAKQIDPEIDSKLNKLKDIIVGKITNPINKDNRKILIFTTFSDTAQYLYENLAEHAQNINMNAALVVGSGTNRSTIDIPNEYKNQMRLSDINT